MHYFNDERSGVNGFRLMSKGWKGVSEKIKSQQPLNDKNEIKSLDIIETVATIYQLKNKRSSIRSKSNC